MGVAATLVWARQLLPVLQFPAPLSEALAAGQDVSHQNAFRHECVCSTLYGNALHCHHMHAWLLMANAAVACAFAVSAVVQSKELHQKAMQLALDKFGVAHATATLARGNLVDALDQLGEREAARALLNDSVNAIKEVQKPFLSSFALVPSLYSQVSANIQDGQCCSSKTASSTCVRVAFG